MVLQIQLKATTAKTTDKISAIAFEKVTQVVNISMISLYHRVKYKFLDLLSSKAPPLLLMVYCTKTPSVPHCFFNASLENTYVLPLTSTTLSRNQSVRPPLNPSITSRESAAQ